MEDLTGNDLALCLGAVALALNWHRDQPRCEFTNREIAKLKTLNKKLSAVFDWAYPENYVDRTGGEEVVLTSAADRFGMVEGRAELGFAFAIGKITPADEGE